LLRRYAEKQQSNLHPPSHDWQDSLCLEALYADLATASGREVEERGSHAAPPLLVSNNIRVDCLHSTITGQRSNAMYSEPNSLCRQADPRAWHSCSSCCILARPAGSDKCRCRCKFCILQVPVSRPLPLPLLLSSLPSSTA
jgi:hypothetical protein